MFYELLKRFWDMIDKCMYKRATGMIGKLNYWTIKKIVDVKNGYFVVSMDLNTNYNEPILSTYLSFHSLLVVFWNTFDS